MFERSTDRARRVLNLAQEEARLLNHDFIGTECILLGLIHEGEGIAAKALESLGVTLTATRQKVQEHISGKGSAPGGSPPFTPRAKKVLELALREALQLGHSYIGTEHLLLGLVREGEGVAVQVLVSLGVEPARVRQRVIQLMSGHQGKEAGPRRPHLGLSGSKVERQPSTVGRRWSAEVVVAGRQPEDFAAAYDQLAELARRLGLENLDADRLHLSSVETVDGPGLRISLTHELPPEDGGGGEVDQTEPPVPGGTPVPPVEAADGERAEDTETGIG